MKDRSKGFLRDELISHTSEQFDYISELHDYLWRFVRVAIPGASGSLKDYLPAAIEALETRSPPRPDLMKLHDETVRILKDWVEASPIPSQQGNTP